MAMREPQKRTLKDDDGNDVNYLLTTHPAAEGLKLASRLFGMAGPSLAGLLGGAVKGRGLDADVDMGAIIRELATAALSTDVAGLLRDLVKYAVRNGVQLDNPGAFDVSFAGNYGELAELAAWVIEANGFVRFFARALGGMSRHG